MQMKGHEKLSFLPFSQPGQSQNRSQSLGQWLSVEIQANGPHVWKNVFQLVWACTQSFMIL